MTRLIVTETRNECKYDPAQARLAEQWRPSANIAAWRFWLGNLRWRWFVRREKDSP